MPYTRSKNREVCISDLSEYAIASSSNPRQEEASLDSRFDSTFLEQLKELVNNSFK